jgi:hypothetical protein
MTTQMITDYDYATGETNVRPATPAEVTQHETLAAAQSALEAEAEVKATAKAALLTKLGITAEEAALLLG